MSNIQQTFRLLLGTSDNLIQNRLLATLVLKGDNLVGYIGNTTKLFKSLLAEYRNVILPLIDPTQPSTTTDVGGLGPRDFRMRAIRLSAVRGIPGKKAGNPFGIDLCDADGNCMSAVIVGGNGVGKSSIFAALEYVYVGELSEAGLRYQDVDRKLFESYLGNIQDPNQQHIEIHTADSQHPKYTHLAGQRIADIEGLDTVVNPDSSFASEYDIFHLSKLRLDEDIDSHLTRPTQTLQSAIASLLGLGGLIEADALLGAIQKGSKTRRTERQAAAEINARIEEITKELQLVKDEIDKKIQSLESVLPSEPWESAANMGRIEHQLREYVAPIAFSPEQLFTIRRSLLSLMQQKEQIARSGDSIEVIEFLQRGIQLLNRSSGCPFCEASRLEKPQIVEHVQSKLEALKRIVALEEHISRISAAFNKELKDLSAALTTSVANQSSLSQVVAGTKEFTDWTDASLKASDMSRALLASYQESISETEGKSVEHWTSSMLDFVGLNSERISEVFTTWVTCSGALAKARLEFQRGLEKKTLAGVDPRQRAKVELSQLQDKKRVIEERLETSIGERDDVIKDVRALDDISSDVNFIKTEFARHFERAFQNRFGPLRDTTTLITSSLFDSQIGTGELLRFGFEAPPPDEDEPTQMKLTLKILHSNGKSISPKAGLNSFRWKRVYSSLSLAIAIAMRATSQINLPLVIDDEVLGADSTNKAEATSFFEKLILEYRIHAPELPLQILIFTADEFLLDCIRAGIDSASEKIREINERDIARGVKYHEFWSRSFIEQTLFARLFPPSDSEFTPRTSRYIGDKYWSLVGELPSSMRKLQKALEKAAS